MVEYGDKCNLWNMLYIIDYLWTWVFNFHVILFINQFHINHVKKTVIQIVMCHIISNLQLGKRATPTWLMSVEIAGADRSWWKFMKLKLSAITVAFISCRATSTADESHSAGWKLQFHQFSSWSVCFDDVYRH